MLTKYLKITIPLVLLASGHAFGEGNLVETTAGAQTRVQPQVQGHGGSPLASPAPPAQWSFPSTQGTMAGRVGLAGIPSQPKPINPTQYPYPYQAAENRDTQGVTALRERLAVAEQEGARLKALVDEKNAALDRAIRLLAKATGIKPPKVPKTPLFVKPPVKQAAKQPVAAALSGMRPQVDVRQSPVGGYAGNLTRETQMPPHPLAEIEIEDTAALLNPQGWETANFTGLGPVQAKYGAAKTYLKISESKVVQAVDILRRGLISYLPTKDGQIGFVLSNKALVIK